MAYLNLDPDYFQHPKTTRLEQILGLCSGIYPLKLWAWCAKYSKETGELKGLNDKGIEIVIGWNAEPGRAIEALLSIGFIDKKGDKYFVHDWSKHEGHIKAFSIRGKINTQERWKNITNHEKRSRRLSKARSKGSHSKEQWAKLLSTLGYVCMRCSRDKYIVKDHIIPIYQGGSDALDNLQPLCASCNSSKGPDNRDYRIKYLKTSRNLTEEMAIKCLQECLQECLQNAYEMPAPNLTIPNLTKPNNTSAGKPRVKDNFHLLMDRLLPDFCSIDPLDGAAVSAAYRRFGRAGRDILAFAGGDPEKAYKAVSDVADWLQNKGLSWSLDTAAKWLPDALNGGLNVTKEKN